MKAPETRLTGLGEMLHVHHDPLGVSSRLVVVHLPCHDVSDPGGAAADGTRGTVQALGVLLPQRHDAPVHVLQDVALCKHSGTALTHTSCALTHHLHTQLSSAAKLTVGNLHRTALKFC